MRRFRRISTVSTGLLLACLAAVVGWRGIRLAGGSPVLDGRDEKSWFAWAYPDPRIGSVYGALRPRLVPGERLVLVTPPRGLSPLWLGVMAHYYLPDHVVVEARVAGEPGKIPPGVAVVRLSPSGEATVRRPKPGQK